MVKSDQFIILYGSLRKSPSCCEIATSKCWGAGSRCRFCWLCGVTARGSKINFNLILAWICIFHFSYSTMSFFTFPCSLKGWNFEKTIGIQILMSSTRFLLNLHHRSVSTKLLPNLLSRYVSEAVFVSFQILDIFFWDRVMYTANTFSDRWFSAFNPKLCIPHIQSYISG